MPLSLHEVRGQFPALQEIYHQNTAIFCDGPGGSQTPTPVIMAMREYLSRYNANTGGVFDTSQATGQIQQEAHNLMADLFNAAPHEIVFGANMTSLTYQISRSLGQNLAPGDEIVLSRLDHEANIAPWLQMAQERELVVHWIEPDLVDCSLQLDQLQSLLSRRTKLVAVGYASNFSGTVNPIAQITQWAHTVGALVYVDAVHFAPHRLIDVQALNCDFLVTSAYKHFGPHVGVLFGKERHLNRLPVYQVRTAKQELPGKFEIGTPNFEGLAGVCACVEYIISLSAADPDIALSASRREQITTAWTVVQDYEAQLMHLFLSGLKAIPGMRLYGPANLHDRVPTFALRKAGTTPRELTTHLANHNIFAWDGNFYALEIARALGVEDSGGVLRVGFLHYNTQDEVNTVLNVLDTA